MASPYREAREPCTVCGCAPCKVLGDPLPVQRSATALVAMRSELITWAWRRGYSGMRPEPGELGGVGTSPRVPRLPAPARPVDTARLAYTILPEQG